MLRRIAASMSLHRTVFFSLLFFSISMFSSNHGTRALFQTSLQERSTYQRIWLIPTFRSLNDICKFFAEFSRKLLIFKPFSHAAGRTLTAASTAASTAANTNLAQAVRTTARPSANLDASTTMRTGKTEFRWGHPAEVPDLGTQPTKIF